MPINKTLAQHYSQLLGLTSPWQITDLTVSIEDQRIDITIEWPSGKPVPCPECGKLTGIKDHREARIWRHLDTMQFQTFLHCRVPRSECKTHNVKTIAIPWSEPGSRWTLLFEAFALLIMESVPALTKSSSILHLTWDEAHALRARAVARGLARRDVEDIEHLGIDEKSFGRKERFVTVLSDLTGERVLDVAPSKSTEAAKTVLAEIPEDVRSRVKAVAMDMTAAYESACAELMPQADIVYDKFHIEQMLSKAMDAVRRLAHKELLQQGITVLAGKRYVFLRRPANWKDRDRELYREVEEEFGAARFAQSKVGRGWAIKETFPLFWDYIYPGNAMKFFTRWFYWATHSRLEPFIRVAYTIKEHMDGVLNYFVHRITNAFAEGMNSRIQYIKSAARGYRNFQNYRTAILFHCGKLDMRPEGC